MDPEIWDVILLGRGSAARYYLTTVDRSLFPNILAVGQDDPWAGERGMDESDPKSPVNFINQTLGMIESFDNPNVPFSTDLVNRLTFAQRTSELIDKYATKVVKQKVVDVLASDVELVPRGDRSSGRKRTYMVKLNDGQEYRGKKVVVATGAGPHREPLEVQGLTKSYSNVVMDMNTFARQVGSIKDPEKRTVFIHGPNAAIDTADVAKYRKFNVVWLVKQGTGKNIPLLATNHQIYAKEAKEKNVKEYPDTGGRTAANFTVSVQGNVVTVKIGSEVLTGDFYVYGMGQDPDTAMEGVIPPVLRDKLVPIYDINQRYGAVHETVLGFKLENSDWDNGFEVIGSLCTQVARKQNGVKHTYLTDLAKTIEEVRSKVLQHMMFLPRNAQGKDLYMKLDELASLECDQAEKRLAAARSVAVAFYPTWENRLIALVNLMVNYNVAAKYFGGTGEKKVGDSDLDRVAKILTPSTVASAQLGGVRTTTAAMNGFATKTPNLSQDDRTILRFSMAVNYPFISEKDAQAIIQDIIGQNTKTEKTGRNDLSLGGYCYTESQKQAFLQRMDDANTRGFAALTQRKDSGTGQTPKKWVMKTERQVFV